VQKGIIGRKVGMTQIFDENGKVIPVTVIEAGPCVVVQKKSVEVDGYTALQLGFSDLEDKKTTKPQKGNFEKNNVPVKKYLKEFFFDEDKNVGDVLTADVFAAGEVVDVVGISKGKGYAGTIKRFNFSRGRMSHGGGPVHRHAGSMGANTDPSRVMPGKRMPGHMGSEQVTIQNLDVVKVDVEKNLLVIRGAIPGPRGGIVFVKTAVKA
jgi:large subunit ribosomal protein L3